jgi:predicted DNA-binding transcriptional regulator YafY
MQCDDARMRRADRLFRIIQLVRGRRLSTATWLAEKLEVSERTVYRDVAALQAQGVPLDGEAGVGYRLRADFELPPLMFSHDEARALVAAVRIAQSRLDPRLAEAAETAIGKILSVLPSAARAAAESVALFAPPVGPDAPTLERLETLRLAIEAHRKVSIDYLDLKEVASTRVIRPLGCFYWGAVWTFAGWCEKRQDFRTFRIDRIRRLEMRDEVFRDEPGRGLADLMRQIERTAGM